MFSKIKIEANGEDEEEPVRLQDEHSADRHQADIIYENMEKVSNNADEQTKLIIFHLEKTLPLPFLRPNKAYYSRQRCLYNFGVHY